MFNFLKKLFSPYRYNPGDVLIRTDGEVWSEYNEVMILQIGKRNYRYVYLDSYNKGKSFDQLKNGTIFSTVPFSVLECLYEKKET